MQLSQGKFLKKVTFMRTAKDEYKKGSRQRDSKSMGTERIKRKTHLGN